LKETARLRIFGRVDLDGTHRAVIESNSKALKGLQREGGPAPLLRLSAGRIACGVMLAEYRLGEAESLHVDRLKLRHLGLKDGEVIEVCEVAPKAARRIVLQAPQSFSNRDFVRFIGKPVVAKEKMALFSFSGESCEVTVARVDPEGPVIIDAKTELKITSDDLDDGAVSYDDIGGLHREVERIREVAEYPFRFPEVFAHLGVTPPKGIILYGPPGTGKTLIAKALAHETGARFYAVSGPEIYSKWYGKSEASLRNVFEEAVRNAPSIVVVDELDALVPRREKTHGDQEQRIVATFLTQMDGLKRLGNVVVLGTTNRVDAIDPALRRGGRFECEVFIGPPDAAGREEILKIHTRGMPLAQDVRLDEVAHRLTAYVGADIASLCREAAYTALRRTVDLSEVTDALSLSLSDIRVTGQDFEIAAARVSPSGGKGFLAEIPPVRWEEIGGVDETKQMLEENIALDDAKQTAFETVGIAPARGILLYGPPGTGKTLLARAVATECGANFIAVKGAALRSPWHGETEANIRQVFQKARTLAPCVIFFDEMDAAVPKRDTANSRDVDAAVNQVLAEMDGVEQLGGVVVIGATNRIELLDPAVLRPGRFDYHIKVPLPDAEARRAIFDVHLRNRKVAEGVDRSVLSTATQGFSGADIAEVCRDAAWSALRRGAFDPSIVCITIDDLNRSIERIGAMVERR
jgi:transitional endoplasmic reticulum ATPase